MQSSSCVDAAAVVVMLYKNKQKINKKFEDLCVLEDGRVVENEMASSKGVRNNDEMALSLGDWACVVTSNRVTTLRATNF